MELQGTQDSQNNPKEREQHRSHTSQFQNLLQSNNNQDSMVLAHESESMKQN